MTKLSINDYSFKLRKDLCESYHTNARLQRQVRSIVSMLTTPATCNGCGKQSDACICTWERANMLHKRCEELGDIELGCKVCRRHLKVALYHGGNWSDIDTTGQCRPRTRPVRSMRRKDACDLSQTDSDNHCEVYDNIATMMNPEEYEAEQSAPKVQKRGATRQRADIVESAVTTKVRTQTSDTAFYTGDTPLPFNDEVSLRLENGNGYGEKGCLNVPSTVEQFKMALSSAGFDDTKFRHMKRANIRYPRIRYLTVDECKRLKAEVYNTYKVSSQTVATGNSIFTVTYNWVVRPMALEDVRTGYDANYIEKGGANTVYSYRLFPTVTAATVLCKQTLTSPLSFKVRLPDMEPFFTTSLLNRSSADMREVNNSLRGINQWATNIDVSDWANFQMSLKDAPRNDNHMEVLLRAMVLWYTAVQLGSVDFIGTVLGVGTNTTALGADYLSLPEDMALFIAKQGAAKTCINLNYTTNRNEIYFWTCVGQPRGTLGRVRYVTGVVAIKTMADRYEVMETQRQYTIILRNGLDKNTVTNDVAAISADSTLIRQVLASPRTVMWYIMRYVTQYDLREQFDILWSSLPFIVQRPDTFSNWDIGTPYHVLDYAMSASLMTDCIASYDHLDAFMHPSLSSLQLFLMIQRTIEESLVASQTLNDYLYRTAVTMYTEAGVTVSADQILYALQDSASNWSNGWTSDLATNRALYMYLMSCLLDRDVTFMSTATVPDRIIYNTELSAFEVSLPALLTIPLVCPVTRHAYIRLAHTLPRGIMSGSGLIRVISRAAKLFWDMVNLGGTELIVSTLRIGTSHSLSVSTATDVYTVPNSDTATQAFTRMSQVTTYDQKFVLDTVATHPGTTLVSSSYDQIAKMKNVEFAENNYVQVDNSGAFDNVARSSGSKKRGQMKKDVPSPARKQQINPNVLTTEEMINKGWTTQQILEYKAENGMINKDKETEDKSRRQLEESKRTFRQEIQPVKKRMNTEERDKLMYRYDATRSVLCHFHDYREGYKVKAFFTFEQLHSNFAESAQKTLGMVLAVYSNTGVNVLDDKGDIYQIPYVYNGFAPFVKFLKCGDVSGMDDYVQRQSSTSDDFAYKYEPMYQIMTLQDIPKFKWLKFFTDIKWLFFEGKLEVSGGDHFDSAALALSDYQFALKLSQELNSEFCHSHGYAYNESDFDITPGKSYMYTELPVYEPKPSEGKQVENKNKGKQHRSSLNKPAEAKPDNKQPQKKQTPVKKKNGHDINKTPTQNKPKVPDILPKSKPERYRKKDEQESDRSHECPSLRDLLKKMMKSVILELDMNLSKAELYEQYESLSQSALRKAEGHAREIDKKFRMQEKMISDMRRQEDVRTTEIIGLRSDNDRLSKDNRELYDEISDLKGKLKGYDEVCKAQEQEIARLTAEIDEMRSLDLTNHNKILEDRIEDMEWSENSSENSEDEERKLSDDEEKSEKAQPSASEDEDEDMGQPEKPADEYHQQEPQSDNESILSEDEGVGGLDTEAVATMRSLENEVASLIYSEPGHLGYYQNGSGCYGCLTESTILGTEYKMTLGRKAGSVNSSSTPSISSIVSIQYEEGMLSTELGSTVKVRRYKWHTAKSKFSAWNRGKAGTTSHYSSLQQIERNHWCASRMWYKFMYDDSRVYKNSAYLKNESLISEFVCRHLNMFKDYYTHNYNTNIGDEDDCGIRAIAALCTPRVKTDSIYKFAKGLYEAGGATVTDDFLKDGSKVWELLYIAANYEKDVVWAYAWDRGDHYIVATYCVPTGTRQFVDMELKTLFCTNNGKHIRYVPRLFWEHASYYCEQYVHNQELDNTYIVDCDSIAANGGGSLDLYLSAVSDEEIQYFKQRVRYAVNVDEVFPFSNSLGIAKAGINLNNVLNIIEEHARKPKTLYAILAKLRASGCSNQMASCILLWVYGVSDTVTISIAVEADFLTVEGYLDRLKEMHNAIRVSKKYKNVLLADEQLSNLMYLYCFVGRPLEEADWMKEMLTRITERPRHARLKDGLRSELSRVEMRTYINRALDLLINKDLLKKPEHYQEFIGRSYEWLANGATTGVNDKNQCKAELMQTVGSTVPVVSVKKRAYMAYKGSYPLSEIVSVKPQALVSTHTKKNEYGKVRSLFACDYRNYIAFCYFIDPIEEAIYSDYSLLNYQALDNLILFERIRGNCQAGVAYTSYDFEDFNSQHSIEDQMDVVYCLYQLLCSKHVPPPEYEAVYHWCYQSFANMVVEARADSTPQYLIKRGLCSGHRLTTVINTILNTAYCEIILDSMRDQGLEVTTVQRVHFGDDVIIGFSTLDQAKAFNSIGMSLGYDANASKLLVEEGRCELTRIMFDRGGYARGSVCRAIAGFVWGNWETKEVMKKTEAITNIHEACTLLMRRGMEPSLCRHLQENCYTYFGEKVGMVVDVKELYTSKRWGGQGCFIGNSRHYEGQWYKRKGLPQRTIPTNEVVQKYQRSEMILGLENKLRESGVLSVKFANDQLEKITLDAAKQIIMTVVDAGRDEAINDAVVFNGRLEDERIRTYSLKTAVQMENQVLQYVSKKAAEALHGHNRVISSALNARVLNNAANEWVRSLQVADNLMQQYDAYSRYMTTDQKRKAKNYLKSRINMATYGVVNSLRWSDDMSHGWHAPMLKSVMKALYYWRAMDSDLTFSMMSEVYGRDDCDLMWSTSYKY